MEKKDEPTAENPIPDAPRRYADGTYDIRAIAATLYGEGLSDTAYISKLAASLNTSESGVHKWWYGQRKVPGSVRVTLDLLLKEEPTVEKPIPDRVRRYKDGSVMPNHIFENEPDEATVLKYADMPDEKRKELSERMDRAIAGDEDAMVGWKF